MANGQPAVSFDEIIQEGRKKRQAEKLAQEIFGKNRRLSAPQNAPKTGLGGSLASRVGINKRNSSIPRVHTPRNNPRPAAPSPLHSRPAPTENYRPRASYIEISSDPPSDAKSNGYARDEIENGGGDVVSFKGAAGPYTVVAQNFALGTTAADIESVMLSVGGQMQSCRLLASDPTVIAEMAFIEKAGAEKVIDTFNGKKADGRPLYVYSKHNGGVASKQRAPTRVAALAAEPPAPPFRADEVDDVAMEVDENAESRAAENRRREERRGRDDRVAREVLPTGPKAYQPPERDDYYDRRPRQAEHSYQDGRYGFGSGGRGGGGGGGYRDGGRDRFSRGGGGGDRRMYGRGQSWRP